jgi:hypothetical protein
MKDNLKDILSNLNPNVDQETLMLYLQGKLSAEKQHELEKHMLADDFETDALDGLQAIQNTNNISHIVEQLNSDLRKKTTIKKNRRQKLEVKAEPWIWIAILIILLLVVISYIIIHQHLQQA